MDVRLILFNCCKFNGTPDLSTDGAVRYSKPCLAMCCEFYQRALGMCLRLLYTHKRINVGNVQYMGCLSSFQIITVKLLHFAPSPAPSSYMLPPGFLSIDNPLLASTAPVSVPFDVSSAANQSSYTIPVILALSNSIDASNPSGDELVASTKPIFPISFKRKHSEIQTTHIDDTSERTACASDVVVTHVQESSIITSPIATTINPVATGFKIKIPVREHSHAILCVLF